jgi:mycothiol S-conjugate amidase
MADARCLLTVHAHPDDESSKGPCTVAKYHAAGVETVLVCCTGGEEGDIHNSAVVLAEGESLGARRATELGEACSIIGYDELVWLGYRDSGMPDSAANTRADAFANAPLDEAVARLVAVVRRRRPQVLITYPDAQHEYPHPDHLRAHEISVAAFDAAADREFHPELGEPHEISKLYYTVWPAQRMLKLHDAYLERGLESPYTSEFLERMGAAEPFTTTIDVTGFAAVRDQALMAHATQIDPDSKWWFGLPAEVRDAAHPFEHYRLAKSRVGGVDVDEDDLFVGIGDEPSASALPAQ